MLKQIHARRGQALSDYILDAKLPQHAFAIALECQWIPGEAATSREWRDWIEQLLAGRYSRVGLEDSYQIDPYRFVPFPVAVTGRHEEPNELPTARLQDNLSPIDADSNREAAGGRAAFVLPMLKNKGWSILDWASHSNVDFHTASGYLKGKTKPYPSTRKKLAQSLGLTAAELPS
jgi:hypothetical protein